MNKTPNLLQLLDEIIDTKLLEVHTSLPATIVSYDYDKNLAVVKPSLKRKYKKEDSPVELPLINDVPVGQYRLGESWIRLPVNVGDEGQLIINERSIDKWINEGGTVDPEDFRKFSLADAVFWPGLTSQKNLMKSKSKKTSIEIKNKKGIIEITADGKFKITNGELEAMTLLVELVEKLIAAKVNTAIGPQPFWPETLTALNQLKEKFSKLKA